MAIDINELEGLTVYLHKDVLVKMIYAWMVGVRYNLPSISKAQAVSQFYKYHNLTESGFMKQASALREVYRLEIKIRNWERNDNAIPEPVHGQQSPSAG